MTDAAPTAFDPGAESLRVADLIRCFEGAVPAVVCTVDADGIPNVTYISRVHPLDGERVALSNQFMSKTSRNLVHSPVACLLMLDPISYEEYRLTIRYERTERHGPVFDRLRADVEGLAELTDMQSVFRLRAADIFRVSEIVRVNGRWDRFPDPAPPSRSIEALAEFAAIVDRSSDLATLIDVGIDALDRILGYHHVALLLLDETGRRLYTLAGRGFPAQNLGSEVALGEGPIGAAVARCELVRVSGLRHLARYSRTVRGSFERSGVPTAASPLPALPDADCRVVAPMLSLGQLVGAIVAEHLDGGAFDPTDEAVLGAAATMLAGAILQARSLDAEHNDHPEPAQPTDPTDAADAADETGATVPTIVLEPALDPDSPGVEVRCFEQDGTVFLDDTYLIRGVAGRILQRLVRDHVERGRCDFTNRELRLDPSLDLPGFKDNLESRLVLLKRRLDEREAPLRIERTGRGRFRLEVEGRLRVTTVGADQPA